MVTDVLVSECSTPVPCLCKNIFLQMCNKKKTKTASEEEMYIIISNKPYGVFCHHLLLNMEMCLLYDCNVQASVSK